MTTMPDDRPIPDSTVEKPRLEKRRAQFSLRDLMLFVTAFGFYCSQLALFPVYRERGVFGHSYIVIATILIAWVVLGVFYAHRESPGTLFLHLFLPFLGTMWTGLSMFAAMALLTNLGGFPIWTIVQIVKRFDVRSSSGRRQPGVADASDGSEAG